MTTNLGTAPDFRSPEEVFSSELLGRVDAQVRYQPLSTETLREIARKEVSDTTHRRARQGWKLDIGEGVADWIAAELEDSVRGARDLHREMDHCLLAPLVAFPERSVRVRVRQDGNGLVFGG